MKINNKELIEVLINRLGTIEDIKGNEFSDVYHSDWDEIIETVRCYDAFENALHDGKVA